MCLPFFPRWSKAGSKGRISLLQCGYNIWACLNPVSTSKARWSVTTPTRRYTLMPFEISPVASSTSSSSECVEDGEGYKIEARALGFFMWIRIINLHSHPSNRTRYCWHPLHFPSPGEGKVLRTCRVRRGCVGTRL
jgi:hypothetical protein